MPKKPGAQRAAFVFLLKVPGLAFARIGQGVAMRATAGKTMLRFVAPG